MPRCNAQLARDLAKSQAKSAKAKHGREAVQATVELQVCVEFINESEPAIPPCPAFEKFGYAW